MLKKNKLRFVSFAYPLMTLLVIFGHSHPVRNEWPLWFRNIVSFIYLFHMPVFFFCTGLLMDYTESYLKKGVMAWIKGKALKLLVPYFVLSLAAYIPKVLVSEYTTDRMSFQLYDLLKAVFSPRDGVWGHFWFIPAYLLISFFCAVIFSKTGKKVKIFILAVTLILNIRPIYIDWFAIKDVTENMLYCFMGVMLSKEIINKRTVVFKPLYLLFAFLLSAAAFSLYDNYYLNKILTCFMIYTVIGVSVSIEEKQIKSLDYIYKNMFSIYIYSWPFQAVTEVIMSGVLLLPWYFVSITMFITGLFGPIAMIEIYKRTKIKNKFLNLLFGVNDDAGYVCKNIT